MSDLSKQLDSLATGADAFKAEHGTCEVVVSPSSPIAKARIEQVAGFRVQAAEFHFRNVKTGEKTLLGDSEVYFHCDDHPLFGSNAPDEDDFDATSR